MSNLHIKDSVGEWYSYPPNFDHDMLPVEIAEAVAAAPLHNFKLTTAKTNTNEKSSETTIFKENFQFNNPKINNVSISGFSKNGEFIVYKVEVHIPEFSWYIFRRYREFHKLHENLVQLFGIPNELMPPKKVAPNQDLHFIDERKNLLEKYLREVIILLPNIPQVLKQFLEMEKFDVHYICQQLAIDVFNTGNIVLSRNNLFKINLIQLHALNRSLCLPQSLSDDKRADIGNLYSFVQNLEKLLIYPGILKRVIIGQKDLQCNFNIFRALKYLEICNCDIGLLQGFEHLQENLQEICIHKSITGIKDLALTNVTWSQVSPESKLSQKIEYQFNPWIMLKKATLSYNNILHLDSSLQLFPSLMHLDLSHNSISEVECLEELLCLTNLDLSFNVIRNVDEFSYKLPCITSLNISANQLMSIIGLEKLYSLEVLNVSQNKLQKVTDVILLGKLPLLHTLLVHSNPFTDVYNYREMIWASFSRRACEVSLDGHTPNKKELVSITNDFVVDTFNIVFEFQKLKVSKILDMEEQYVIIPDDIFSKDQKEPCVSPAENLKLASPLASPRVKKKDRIVNIGQSESKKTNFSNKKVADDGFLRGQIEKLRTQAGDSWLTVYNEILDGKEENLSRLNTWYIDNDDAYLELNDELRKKVKDYVNSHLDLKEETFLVINKNNSVKERMITFDLESMLIIETDLLSGSPVNSYDLGCVQNLNVESSYILSFNTKQSSDKSFITVKLHAQSIHDMVGLYAILKSYSLHQKTR